MNNEKTKKIYKITMLIIVVALITFVFTTAFIYKKVGFGAVSNAKGTNSELIKKIQVVKTIIDSEYLSNVEEQDLVEGAIKGYINGLGDDYTQYFTKEEMKELKTDTIGNYVGIGIYMFKNTKDNNIIVLFPIENSPAEEAGILSGDIIKKVNGIEYTGDDFEKVSSDLEGKEGTKANIEILRGNETLTFEVERRKVELYPIKSKILKNNIGYIKITSFDQNCANKIKEVYQEFSNNIQGLIIDLRNNGGGILQEALKISDYALEKDATILITKDKQGNEKIEKSNQNPIITVPIVILTNENSASASEVLVAALKENNRATIVGEKTYGKGVIQELITLSDGSGIKITTEKYYTPNRNEIDKLGILPDKEIKLSEEIINIYNIEEKDDTQLQEALKCFKNKD